MPTLFAIEANLDSTQLHAVATGHVAPVMAWEDGPIGTRRPGTTPDVDDAGTPFQIADVMLPLGRDGKPELFGVRFASHEVPTFEPYTPVDRVGLRMRVRGSKTGKGVDVTFSADAVRPAAPQRTGRRAQAESEAA